MANSDPDTVLFRIDPARNIARFYAISIQPNLFGGVTLIRNWGRIGSCGQLRCALFDDLATAAKAQQALAKAKQSRGYTSEQSANFYSDAWRIRITYLTYHLGSGHSRPSNSSNSPGLGNPFVPFLNLY